jgi:hypothetical protein
VYGIPEHCAGSAVRGEKDEVEVGCKIANLHHGDTEARRTAGQDRKPFTTEIAEERRGKSENI